MAEETAEAAQTPFPSLGMIEPEQRLQAIPEIQEYAEQAARGIHQGVLNGGPPTRRLADFFHGTWLGHPLHSVLTDVTIGAWMLGSFMDWISAGTRARWPKRAADSLITIGTVSAVPTALAGLTDFSTIPSDAAATGAAHGLINTVALTCYAWSLRSRKTGDRGTALLLSGIGFGLIMVSAWLGGELAYRYRVGVNRVKKPTDPKTWTAILADEELAEHQPKKLKVEGEPVVLYRSGRQIYAIGAVCPHAEGPLEDGDFMGEVVQCPLHQSVYELSTGRVVHGPSTYAVPSYEARVRKGQIEVRLRQAA